MVEQKVLDPMPSSKIVHADDSSHIVFVTQRPFGERELSRYGVDTFLSRGIRISILDVADIVVPGLEHDRKHYKNSNYSNVHVARNKIDLAASKKLLADASIIFCLTGTGYPTATNYSVLQAISRSGTPYAIFFTAPLPMSTFGPGAGPRRSLWARFKSVGIFNAVLARLPLRFMGLKPADFLVTGGYQGRRVFPLTCSKTRTIETHAPDFETYLAEKKVASKITKTAVYLDTAMGLHSDLLDRGRGMVVDPDDFYRKLRLLFSRIEKELGLEVVIAAHPRSNYNKMPKLFGERKIFYGKTPQLLHRCRLALGLHSTATNLAVLFRKPIMVITVKDILTHPLLVSGFEKLAAALGREITLIDDPYSADLGAALTIDNEAYEKFIADYIKTPESPASSLPDILIKKLTDYGVFRDSKNY
jgi:hypothetical protein